MPNSLLEKLQEIMEEIRYTPRCMRGKSHNFLPEWVRCVHKMAEVLWRNTRKDVWWNVFNKLHLWHWCALRTKVDKSMLGLDRPRKRGREATRGIIHMAVAGPIVRESKRSRCWSANVSSCCPYICMCRVVCFYRSLNPSCSVLHVSSADDSP